MAPFFSENDNGVTAGDSERRHPVSRLEIRASVSGWPQRNLVRLFHCNPRKGRCAALCVFEENAVEDFGPHGHIWCRNAFTDLSYKRTKNLLPLNFKTWARISYCVWESLSLQWYRRCTVLLLTRM